MGFKGFVVSDWGGTHSTVKAALAGLDMEMPGSIDGSKHFGKALKKAVQDGKVPVSTLNQMDQRILRSMFAVGVVDHPSTPREVVNPFRGRRAARHVAEQSIVLLKNAQHVLPLDPKTDQSVALIGSHADVGVLSGGGSAQVDAPGGNAINPHPGGAKWGEVVYFPSSPLRSIRKQAPHASVTFNSGKDLASAVALARKSQVAIVFVNQPMHEGVDRPTLGLPGNQDTLVKAVAAANPHTVVVLETGGPVTMPWAGQVQGIVEAWYPGIGGAQALANLVFGKVNFSGKLPVTFPRSNSQLPYPKVSGLSAALFREEQKNAQAPIKPFDVDYNKAGAAVGYKWFEENHFKPLFAFGYGLSYTTYAYSDLKVSGNGETASLTVRNTGDRAGTEVAEVYASLPKAAHEDYKRLVGFKRVSLAPGQSKRVAIPLNMLCESIYDTHAHAFKRLPGTYTVQAGPSSLKTPLKSSFVLHDHSETRVGRTSASLR
jgi:beta-glucosidase